MILEVSCAEKNVVVSLVTVEIEMDIHCVFTADDLWRFGLNLSQIDTVLLHSI